MTISRAKARQDYLIAEALAGRGKLISLTQGLATLVDAEDFAALSTFKWFAYSSNSGRGCYYAARQGRRPEGGQIVIQMHRLILGTPEGKHTLHGPGGSLDNRRVNLSEGTSGDNQKGQCRVRSDSTTGFRGVGRVGKKFRARIQNIDNKLLHLGCFDTSEEAARVRDAKARELGWPEEGMNFPRGH